MTDNELRRLVAANAQQQIKNAKNIEALVTNTSNIAVTVKEAETQLAQLEKLVQAKSQAASARNIRCDVFIAEAQEHRRKADADRAAWKADFAEQMNEMRLARERSDQRFEAMLAQLDRKNGRVEAFD